MYEVDGTTNNINVRIAGINEIKYSAINNHELLADFMQPEAIEMIKRGTARMISANGPIRSVRMWVWVYYIYSSQNHIQPLTLTHTHTHILNVVSHLGGPQCGRSAFGYPSWRCGRGTLLYGHSFTKNSSRVLVCFALSG